MELVKCSKMHIKQEKKHELFLQVAAVPLVLVILLRVLITFFVTIKKLQFLAVQKLGIINCVMHLLLSVLVDSLGLDLVILFKNFDIFQRWNETLFFL